MWTLGSPTSHRWYRESTATADAGVALLSNGPEALTGTLHLAVLPATAYDVPAGHSPAVVLDTADPLYLDASRPARPITVAGSSWLDVPMR